MYGLYAIIKSTLHVDEWTVRGRRSTSVEAKITLNRHFFEPKPNFFDFVPKPTLLTDFSVYFDFLKFEVEMSQNGSVGF